MQPSKTSAEERVDRIRASLSANLLPTPFSSTALSSASADSRTQGISSGAVSARSRGGGGGMASMIAAYGRSKEAADETAELGARAYLLKHNPTSLLNAGSGAGDRRATELNKTFLQNTIRSVESHNRREQIDSAWRQHDLLKRLDRGELAAPHDESDQEGSPHRASSHLSDAEGSGAEERSDKEQDSEGERSEKEHGSDNEKEDFLAFSIDRSSSPTGPERPKKLNRFLKNTISSVSSHNRHLLQRAAASAQEHAIGYELSTSIAHTSDDTHAAQNSHATPANKLPVRNKDEEREEGEEEEEEQHEEQEQEAQRSEGEDLGGEEEVEISFEVDRSKALPSHLYTADQRLYSARAASLTNRAAVNERSRAGTEDMQRERQDGGGKRRRNESSGRGERNERCERSESPLARKRRHLSGSEASDSDNSSSSSSQGSDSGSERGDRSRSARSASRDWSRSRSRDKGDSSDRRSGDCRDAGDGAGVDYQAQREMWALRKAQALHNGVYTGTASTSAVNASSAAPTTRTAPSSADKERDSEKKSHKSHKDAKKSKKEKKEKNEKKEKKEKKDKHEKKHKKHRH